MELFVKMTSLTYYEQHYNAVSEQINVIRHMYNQLRCICVMSTVRK